MNDKQDISGDSFSVIDERMRFPNHAKQEFENDTKRYTWLLLKSHPLWLRMLNDLLKKISGIVRSCHVATAAWSRLQHSSAGMIRLSFRTTLTWRWIAA